MVKMSKNVSHGLPDRFNSLSCWDRRYGLFFFLHCNPRNKQCSLCKRTACYMDLFLKFWHIYCSNIFSWSVYRRLTVMILAFTFIWGIENKDFFPIKCNIVSHVQGLKMLCKMGLSCHPSTVASKIKRILKGPWPGAIKMEITGMGWRIKKGTEMLKAKVDSLTYLPELPSALEFKAYVEELKCEALSTSPTAPTTCTSSDALTQCQHWIQVA